MSITWNEIVEVYRSQPWWVWAVALALIWFSLKWLTRSAIAIAERPVVTLESFRQRRVSVDYRAGTITLPRGNTYLVSSVRGLRWEDFSKSGSFHAYIDVDDLAKPTHPVSFSTSDGPEKFIGRLRTAIEKAGGARFAISSNVISAIRLRPQRQHAQQVEGSGYHMAGCSDPFTGLVHEPTGIALAPR